jgi:nucleotide-binding universal stress UspA family protein
MFKHILLACDGTEASRHAAVLAADLAREHGARLTALFVVDPYPFIGLAQTNPLGFQAYLQAAHAQAARAHTEVEVLCSQGSHPVPLQLRLIEDARPADAIAQTARSEGADLIVMGSHGRRAVARLVVGSVTAEVLALTHVPVLVTR